MQSFFDEVIHVVKYRQRNILCNLATESKADFAI